MNRKTFPLGAALVSRTTVLQERLAALGELPFSKMGARCGAEAEGLEDGWGNGFFVTSVRDYTGSLTDLLTDLFNP